MDGEAQAITGNVPDAARRGFHTYTHTLNNICIYVEDTGNVR